MPVSLLVWVPFKPVHLTETSNRIYTASLNIKQLFIKLFSVGDLCQIKETAVTISSASVALKLDNFEEFCRNI